jgi:hypothetical protein
VTAHPTDAEKLQCLLTLAFSGSRALYDEFCDLIREAVPEAQAAVLRGSAITGYRFVDGAPFDADGPGTSDLDLTLIGADVLAYFSAFWIPGIHSKPLSEKDPDIAPKLLPLRDQLTGIVKRPVNIQGTRNWIQHFRGDIMKQPYLTLYGDVEQP